MKKFIEKLKAKGIVDEIQRAFNAACKLFGELSNDGKMEANSQLLINYIENDKELDKEFVKFAKEYTAKAIIKKLDLKADENYEPDELQKVSALMAILKSI